MKYVNKKICIILLLTCATASFQQTAQANPFTWIWHHMTTLTRPFTYSAHAVTRILKHLISRSAQQNQEQSENQPPAEPVVNAPAYTVHGERACIFNDAGIAGRRLVITPANQEEQIVELQEAPVLTQYQRHFILHATGDGGASCGIHAAKNLHGLLQLASGNMTEGLRWLKNKNKYVELMHRPIEGLGQQFATEGTWRKALTEARTKTEMKNYLIMSCLNPRIRRKNILKYQGTVRTVKSDNQNKLYDNDNFDIVKIKNRYKTIVENILNREIDNFLHDPLNYSVTVDGNWINQQILAEVAQLQISEDEIAAYSDHPITLQNIIDYMQNAQAIQRYFNFAQINASPVKLKWQILVALRINTDDFEYHAPSCEWLHGEEIASLYNREIGNLPASVNNTQLYTLDTPEDIEPQVIEGEEEPVMLANINRQAPTAAFALGDMQRYKMSGTAGHWIAIIRQIIRDASNREHHIYTVANSAPNESVLTDFNTFLPFVRNMEGNRGAAIIDALRPPAGKSLMQRWKHSAKNLARRIRGAFA